MPQCFRIVNSNLNSTQNSQLQYMNKTLYVERASAQLSMERTFTNICIIYVNCVYVYDMWLSLPIKRGGRASLSISNDPGSDAEGLIALSGEKKKQECNHKNDKREKRSSDDEKGEEPTHGGE